MTCCLFAMEDWPITPVAFGGAPALIYSHLELMVRAVNQIELVILPGLHSSLGFDAYRKSQPELWNLVSSWCHKVHIIEIRSVGKSLSGFSRLWKSYFNPAMYSYSDLILSQGMQELKTLIQTTKPDLLWAEHLIPATLLSQGDFDCPSVYSHHDWRWKIKGYRSSPSKLDFKQKLKFSISRRHETRLVRQAAACVSGSQTELEEMQRLGAKKVGYFPTTYIPINDMPMHPNSESPRIVHLGGMQTTANRLGLQRFLEICWTSLVGKLSPKPELWIVGNLDGATPELMRALCQDNIVCTGVIEDLRTVLRPFDIHIVPWEYHTGTRTRIPLVMNHSQALVSTRAAASCLPQLESNCNCILVDDLDEMVNGILALYVDAEKRIRIARSGRETFLNFFTREKQQDRFNEFVRSVCGVPQPVLGKC